MVKAKSIKRIFLYDEDNPTTKNYVGEYKHIKAISDDERHYFEFTVNQDDYEQSLKELCDKFENFCVNECGFDDCRYCEVWTVFYPHSKFLNVGNYRSELHCGTLYSLLCGCAWATIYYMETQYYCLCSHLRLPNNKYNRPPTFEEFVAENNYDKLKEPYATKELFNIFNSIINKKQFTKEELHLISDFVANNIYLTDYKKWLNFTINLSDFLSEKLNIDIFNERHKEQKNITTKYVTDNLQTLNVAIIRLFKNDRNLLKNLLKYLDLQYKKYIRKTIKNRKFYED